jgi:hypothetical protein
MPSSRLKQVAWRYKLGSGRMPAFLADDKRFWAGAALLFGTVSLLKGLRVPNLWAATQAYLNYQNGFIKRGLFGEVVRGLGIPIAHYDVFVALSGFLFLIFLALLLRWILISGAQRLADGAVVALFAASYCLTFLAHMIGYLEIPSCALALSALAAAGSRFSLLAILVAGALGVLIHENYLVTFLPLTLLPPFLAAFTKPRPVRELFPVAAVAAAIGVIVLVEALRPPMSIQQAGTLQAAMIAAVDFHPRADFFAVLTRSAGDNVVFMLAIMRKGLWWASQVNALIAFMPTTAFFIWLSFAIIDAGGHNARDRRVVKAAVILAALSPLSLQIVGMDIYRWYALAAFNSFVAMTVVWNRYGKGAEVLTDCSRSVRNLATALIAVNMATGTGLFDFYQVDTFPFIDHWRALLQWIVTGRHWMPPGS